jgi:hypothetical protein
MLRKDVIEILDKAIILIDDENLIHDASVDPDVCPYCAISHALTTARTFIMEEEC